MKWTIHRLRVDATKPEIRLDQYLSQHCPELSRTAAKKIIDLGGVHINGRRVRTCSQQLKAGDGIEVYLDHFPLDPYRLGTTEIVYQDPYIVVLDKPSAIDTQPTHARFKGTLYEALQVHLQNPQRRQEKPAIGMIQRLDRGTSGLIVFSTHQRAHRRLTEIFVEHEVEKGYLALVAGRPPSASGEVRSQLARSRKENRVHSVSAGGKEAITRYHVADVNSEIALLKVALLTGRSHQIRAHLSEQGCPLLGDTRYGGPDNWDGLTFERPLLHAAQLAFPHPVTGQPLNFTAPLPADMQRVVERLRNRASSQDS